MAAQTRRSFLKRTAAAASVVGMGPVNALAQTRRMDELIDEDATGLAERLRAREFTQSELVETFIRRIEVMNPALNFMTNPAFDRARVKADTIPLDAAFAGVPILMKDMIDIGGLPRTDGSRFMLKNVPKRNVDYVDGVEAAGFNILGQTNVPELASFIITNNDVFGATKNPWNPDYSVFSSSGGSAVAVASGVVPMAHGTDGAGSNRLPPSATGIFGMKPSRRRMRSGEADGSHDIAKTNQMLSRTVRDNALAFSLTESQSGDPFPPVGFVSGPSDRRLKVGLVVDDGKLITTDAEILEAQRKVALLMQNLGHEVEETPWPVDANVMADAYSNFFGGKLGGLKSAVEGATGKTVMESGLLTRFLASNIEASAKISPEEIAEGRAFLENLVPVFASVFEKYDVLLAPVAPVVAPSLYEHTPDELFTDELSQYVAARLKFTSPINFAGCPAMSVPLSWSSDLGIPIGSHFIAAEGQDRLLYELAYELEEARPWKNIWAPFSLKYVPV
ncbi:amidase [Shimia thalassica]|uniref:amidase n=1 Tax=Shimia thalassica TaxID=1715693 RepID=UPI0026E1C0E9|nr:amidase family protein [Shimia thalassica]MDO6797210.1 amidase family protein [Shimia thalassica]